MSTRKYVSELEYGNAKGVDTTSPPSMIEPGYARDARNANVGTTGGWKKRDGYTAQLTTPWGSRSIQQGFEYRRASGSLEGIFYGTDEVSDGRLGRLNVGLGQIDTIISGLDPTVRLSLLQFQDRLFGFNGDSTNAPFVYEGSLTAVRELGIAPPTVALTLTPTTGGSLLASSYLYAYTYIIFNTTTSQVLAESSPSTLEDITLNPSQNAVDVGVTASPATVPPGVSLEVRIRLYRTFVDGSIPFLEQEVPNITATLNSTLADNALSTIQLELDNSQLKNFVGYDKARFPVVARNRLFVAHEDRNEVRFSKIGQEGPLPESFQATNFTAVEGKKGSSDRLVGLNQIKGVPIVLKDQSIGRLEEVGLPEVTAAEDLVVFMYRELSDSVGAVTHFAATQVLDELVFLSRDNVYATNGEVVRPIANPIQATIRSLDFRSNKDYKISAVNDTVNRRIKFSVYETVLSAEPNFIIVGNYEQYPEFRWTFYTEGEDDLTHPGIRPASFFQITSTADGSLGVYFGNTDLNGQFYKMNDGEDDDGNGIYFKIASRPYAVGQPMLTKLFKNARIFVEAADNTYQLGFFSSFDLSSEEEEQQPFTIEGLGGKWASDPGIPGEARWSDDTGSNPDALIWSGPALKELVYDPHRKAKFMQLIFKQTDKDAPVSLLGWGVAGAVFGGI